MNRAALAILALAGAATQASAQQTITSANQQIITQKPNLQMLQQMNDKAVLIDINTLIALLDPDPAMNNPDKVSWELFVEANKPSAQAGKALFETWPSDQDTFSPSAKCPPPPNANLVAAAVSDLALRQPALLRLAPRKPGLQPHIVAGGGEEVRRNPAAFNFIVCNKLNTKAGLKAVFDKAPISFPIDSIEVKGEWIPVNATINETNAHVGTAGGKKFALVGLHVISKQVPNWTWATFEHKNNPGRCDYQGCFDKFGASGKAVLPQKPAGGQYPACVKTAALKKMFTDAKLDAVYENYCLKGSQTDFTTSDGLPTLVGNSTIEDDVITPSSCITCHSRAAYDKNGTAMNMGMNQGPVLPSWFYSGVGTPQQKRTFMQTDFVWAIPFNAQ
jgi:hypothetical protein